MLRQNKVEHLSSVCLTSLMTRHGQIGSTYYSINLVCTFSFSFLFIILFVLWKLIHLVLASLWPQRCQFLDALASLDFTLVSQSVGDSFKFEIDLKCKQVIILNSCRLVIIPLCQHVHMSTCHHVIMSA